MKTIKDSIHDHIQVDGVALSLLDTPPLQRLRRVKQLGTVHLVYPSANHTRFEHSLGVYALACEALDQLEVGGRTAERVRAAALLHDVGHPPFSHNVERVLTRSRDGRQGKTHEERARDLVTGGELAETLQSHDLDPERVAGLLAGEGRYGPLISGDLDVDRMDYLVRDAHHTGVPYGTIDHGRLIREFVLTDGELVLDEGNVGSAENMLIARALMNQTVYNHHVARIGKTMLDRATERLLEAEHAAADVWQMDDPALLTALREHEETADIAHRLSTRDLLKRAIWTGFDDVPDHLQEASHEEIRALEVDIADEVGLEPTEVIVDRQSPPALPEASTRVTVRGEIVRLEDASELVGALETAQLERRRFGVYAPPNHRDVVGHAAERVLGLDTDGDLIRRRRGRVPQLSEFGSE